MKKNLLPFLLCWLCLHPLLLSAQCSIGNNNGFEDKVVGLRRPGVFQADANTVRGWRTTASDNRIEIWSSGYEGITAYEGVQFAELNSSEQSTLIKDFTAIKNREITLSFAHRGRLGVDVMKVAVGPKGGPYQYLINPKTNTQNFSDGRTMWSVYQVTYKPDITGPYEMRFEAVSTATGDKTIGNFLDAVNPIASDLSVTIKKPEITCGSAYVTLDGSASTEGDFINYEWLKDGVKIEANNAVGVEFVSDKVIRVTQYGLYILKGIVPGYNCEDVASYQFVESPSSVKVLYPTTLKYCRGSAVTKFRPQIQGPQDLINRTTFTAPAGLSIDANNGEIDLANSTAGQYTITATTTQNNFCATNTLYPFEIVAVAPFTAKLDIGNTDICDNNSTTTLSASTSVNQIYTYNWYFEGQKLDVNTPSIQVNKDGLYQVQISNEGGCIETATANYKRPVPTLNIVPNMDCDGGTLTAEFEPKTNANIHWYLQVNGKFEHIDRANTETITVTQTGVYQAKVSYGGCSFTKEIEVSLRPKAKFQVSANMVCLGQSIAISEIGIENIVDWKWTFSDGGSSQSNSDFKYTFSKLGRQSIRLLVTNKIGCGEILEIPIQVLAVPQASFGFNEGKYWMENEAVDFTNSSTTEDNQWDNIAFNWNYGDGGSSTVRQPNAYTYTKPGNYQVSLAVQNMLGCGTTYSKNIVIHGYPKASFTLSDAKICVKNAITITNTSTAINNTITAMEWYFDDGVNTALDTRENNADNIGKSFTIKYPYPIDKEREVRIRLVIHTLTGHTSEAVQTLTLVPSPLLQFDQIAPICFTAGAVQLQAKELHGLEGTGYYTGNAVSNTGLFDPQTKPSSDYQITYTFVPKYGCTESISQKLNVISAPDADLPPSVQIFEKKDYQPNPIYRGNIIHYQWMDEQGKILSNMPYPTFNFEEDTQLKLLISNANGCETIRSINIIVYKEVQFSNAFSPNGDGVNDVWNIPNLQKYKDLATVSIYNRYGILVYQSIGYDKPWDGTFHGTNLPLGTYYYIIQKQYGKSRLSGSVTILK